MKFLTYCKDGGPESHVWGFFVVEIKMLFTFALMYFADGSRDAYHSHAFHSISWLLKGTLIENLRTGEVITYRPSLRPIFTYRNTFHKVVSVGDSFALTFRGTWVDTWREYLPKVNRFLTL